MDTIKAIKDSGLAPNEVWFISTLILIGVLTAFFWIIAAFFKGYLNEQKDSRIQMSISIAQLTKIVDKLEVVQERHTKEIDSNSEEIKELQKQKQRPR